ncbi:hypothetical protein AHAS_Ahas11G0126600 [Arachis hypogaea]
MDYLELVQVDLDPYSSPSMFLDSVVQYVADGAQRKILNCTKRSQPDLSLATFDSEIERTLLHIRQAKRRLDYTASASTRFEEHFDTLVQSIVIWTLHSTNGHLILLLELLTYP